MKYKRFRKVVKWKPEKRDFFAMIIVSILTSTFLVFVAAKGGIEQGAIFGGVIYGGMLSFMFLDERLRRVYWEEIK